MLKPLARNFSKAFSAVKLNSGAANHPASMIASATFVSKGLQTITHGGR